MSWFAQAPSNIALIKYMGKQNSETNTPTNPSLSFTLNSLLSTVTLECHAGQQDTWEPLAYADAPLLHLSSAAQERFLRHLSYLKSIFNYNGSFIVRSTNNFPHSSGLASSASSFAALTRCAVMALSELTSLPCPSIQEQAQLSRLGSGSSCRSFFSPWVLWDENNHVQPVDMPYQHLLHRVIVISQNEKKVSSSEAHQRIKTSPHHATRSQRAIHHLTQLRQALETHDWARAYQICWDEFQDLHALFSTAVPSFSYINSEAQLVLDQLTAFWEKQGDGPLITMDAGPNIHLLYRPDQIELAEQFQRTYLTGHYDVL